MSGESSEGPPESVAPQGGSQGGSQGAPAREGLRLGLRLSEPTLSSRPAATRTLHLALHNHQDDPDHSQPVRSLRVVILFHVFVHSFPNCRFTKGRSIHTKE